MNINSALRRCNKWQNVKFAERAWLSVSEYLTLTDVPTEHGSPTLDV